MKRFCPFGDRGITVLVLTFSVVGHTSPISTQIPNSRQHEGDRIVYPENLENEVKIQNTQTKEDVGLGSLCPETGARNVKVAVDLDQAGVNCYEIGRRGPCPSNMNFYAVPENNEFGMCDCDQGVKGLVYSNHTKTCVHLFHQEYCDDGDWLEFSTEGVTCTHNPCLGYSNESVLFNGSCATAFHECKIGSLLGHVGFDDFNVLKCLPIDTNYSITRSIPMLKCSGGTRWSNLTNSCRKTVHFKFS